MTNRELLLDSLVIGSDRPEELKDWYRTVLGGQEDADGAFVFGPARLFVFPHSEIHGPSAEPARILINFRVEDARAVESELKEKGARFVRDVEEQPFGLLGTIVDLDGNYLQIFEYTPARA